MNTINLIPPQIKIAEKNKKIFAEVFVIFIFMVIIGLIASTALFAINFFTSEETLRTNEMLVEEQTKLSELNAIEKDVVELNSKIEKITSLNQDRVLWSTVISELNHNTPAQLVISTCSLSSKDKKVSFSGSAETRREIVKFQEKLNAGTFFTNMTFDASTFSDSEGMYMFNMNGELK